MTGKEKEVLELIKSRTHLLYTDRKIIAQKYLVWCEKNNVDKNDLVNFVI